MLKLSKISFFLFVFFYNYLWLRIIVFNRFYNLYGSSGFLIGLFFIIGIILLFTFFPKKIFNFDFYSLFYKSNFKWIFSLLTILEVICSVCFISYFFNQIFLVESNIYMIISILSLSIILVGKMTPREIMDISTLFYLFGILLIFISFIFVPKMEIEYVLMYEKKSYFYIIIFSIIIFLDNLKLLINKENVILNKNIFILSILLSLIFFLVEYGVLLMIAGDYVLKDLSYVGFLKLSFMPVTKYFGDFNFVYLYLLIVCSIFKNAYNISLININKYKKLSGILLFINIFICSVFVVNNISIESELYKYNIVLLLSFFILPVWMIWKCHYVRKNKK